MPAFTNMRYNDCQWISILYHSLSITYLPFGHGLGLDGLDGLDGHGLDGLGLNMICNIYFGTLRGRNLSNFLFMAAYSILYCLYI